MSYFASTYTCESSFSALNNIKSKLRASMIDESVESALICAIAKCEPRYLELVVNTELQISH